MWIPKKKRTEKSPWASGFLALMYITVWITPWSLIVIQKLFQALHSGERNSEFTDDCGKRRVFINFIMLKHGWRDIRTMHMGCYKESGGGSPICLEQICRVIALCVANLSASQGSHSPLPWVFLWLLNGVLTQWTILSLLKTWVKSFHSLGMINMGLLQSIFTVQITLSSKQGPGGGSAHL